MSKRRLGNIFKRKFAFDFKKVFMARKVVETGPASAQATAGKEWIKSQLRDFSRFGGELVVMKMGN